MVVVVLVLVVVVVVVLMVEVVSVRAVLSLEVVYVLAKFSEEEVSIHRMNLHEVSMVHGTELGPRAVRKAGQVTGVNVVFLAYRSQPLLHLRTGPLVDGVVLV